MAGVQQASTIQDNAAISKKVADMNAAYAGIDAYNAEQAGITKANRYQSVIDETVGAQKEEMAAKGQNVNFGTAAELNAQTKLTGFLNQLDIKNQADQAAKGYRTQGINIELAGQSQQNQSTMQATGAQSRGVIGGIQTLTSGYTRGGMRNLLAPGYNPDGSEFP